MPEPSSRALAQLDDDALVARSRDGDDVALEALLARYRGFARAKARSYYLVGGDRDDVAQEAMIGLYKAVRDYDAGRASTFRTFADLCITRQILTAVKAANRHKHAPLNRSVSFDRPVHEEGEQTLADALALEVDEDPLARLVETDELADLQVVLREALSHLETDVLELYVDGRSYQEIAHRLGRQVKSVDNALQRIKRKLEGRVEAPEQIGVTRGAGPQVRARA